MATDVSKFNIAAGKLYLSLIIDMHNCQIISFTISKTPNCKQIQDMLDLAFSEQKEMDSLILYSDQGWQYQIQPYHKTLLDKSILQLMSRKVNCLDNAIMENFFGVMTKRCFMAMNMIFKAYMI